MVDDIVIARCKKCGQQYFGWTEKEVLDKFKYHTCPPGTLRRALEVMLDKFEALR